MPNTVTTQGPPEWLQQEYRNFLPSAIGAINRPYQQYQGQRVAGPSWGQNQALQGIYGNMGPTQGTQAANQYLMSLLGGSQNPNIEGVIDRASRDVTDRYNQATRGVTQRFNNPGNWGGVRHQMAQNDANQALATGLADANNSARFNAFESDQSRRMQASSLIQQLQNAQLQNYLQGLNAGGVEQRYMQGLMDVGYEDWMNQWNYPMQQVDAASRLFGLAGQGSGQVRNTQTPDPNRYSQIIGAGLLGLGLF